MLHILYTIIIYPLYALIECVFFFCYRVTENYGSSLVGVSASISLLCLPLYAVAEKRQQSERKKQAAMQKMLSVIKKAFKGDERYMMTHAYYRECHYSPLMALNSSFGLLLQIPFFIAAYQFISNLRILDNKSFFFIKNLGTPDMLASFSSFSINVLPIAMTIINIIAGAIYTKGRQLREKIQIYSTALVFLLILYPSPSGLVLYWTCNNIFSLLKNIFYTFKNPLKVFYICITAILSLASIHFFFFFAAKKSYKLLFAAIFICIICMPFFIKAIHTCLNTSLRSLVADKKQRTVIFISSCITLSLLMGFAIPSSLIASSPIEFADIGDQQNPLFFISNTALQSCGLFLFWALCMYLLFGAQTQALFAVTMSSIAICALINTYFFKLPAGTISSSLTFINSQGFSTLSISSAVNLICIVLIFVACIIYAKKNKIFLSMFTIASIALVAISTINIINIKDTYKTYIQSIAFNESKTKTLAPIFTLSKNNQNVILFMLDKAQSQFFDEIIKEAPEISDIFSGFIYYPNTASYNGHTLIGAPTLYGGYEYTPREMNKRASTTLKEKNNEALLLLPRIFTEENNFSAVITDPSWGNYNTFCDLSFLAPYPNIIGHQTIGVYSKFWNDLHVNKVTDTTEYTLKRNLLFFSIMRSTPPCMRELIYNTGKYWIPDSKTNAVKLLINNYSLLDFLPELTDIKETENGTYTCIVNELTHDGFFLQAPEYEPVNSPINSGTSHFNDNADYHVNMAAFKLLAQYFLHLKENNVYDNTRIVVAADHGGADKESCMENDDELDAAIGYDGGMFHGRGHYHPLFMFKDFGATGSIKTDNTFMTNADTPSLLLRGIVEKPINPFTQKEIPLDTFPLKKDGIILTTSDNWGPESNGVYTFSIKRNQWWHVRDNIFISENRSRFAPEHEEQQ